MICDYSPIGGRGGVLAKYVDMLKRSHKKNGALGSHGSQTLPTTSFSFNKTVFELLVRQKWCID